MKGKKHDRKIGGINIRIDGKVKRALLLVITVLAFILAGVLIPKVLLMIKSATLDGRSGSVDVQDIQPYSAQILAREDAFKDELKYYNQVLDIMRSDSYELLQIVEADKDRFYDPISNAGFYDPMYQIGTRVVTDITGSEFADVLEVRVVDYKNYSFLTIADDGLSAVINSDMGLPMYLNYRFTEDCGDLLTGDEPEVPYVYDDEFYARMDSAWSNVIDAYSRALGIRFLGDVNSYSLSEEESYLTQADAIAIYPDRADSINYAFENKYSNFYTVLVNDEWQLFDWHRCSFYRCAITTDNALRVNMVVNRVFNIIDGEIQWEIEIWVDIAS